MPSEMLGYYVNDGSSCMKGDWSSGRLQIHVTDKAVFHRNGSGRQWQYQVTGIFTESQEDRQEVLVVMKHDDVGVARLIRQVWELNQEKADTPILVVSDDAETAYKHEHSGNGQSSGPPELWFKCTN